MPKKGERERDRERVLVGGCVVMRREIELIQCYDIVKILKMVLPCCAVAH